MHHEDSVMSFWTQFELTKEAFRNASYHKERTAPSDREEILPELGDVTDQSGQKQKRYIYLDTLMNVRKSIASLPGFFRDTESCSIAAGYLDSLEDCTNQIIAQLEKEVEVHDTVKHVILESLPFTRKPTRRQKEVLELWRVTRDAISRKKAALTTSKANVIFTTLLSVAFILGFVYVCVKSGVWLGKYFHPKEDGTQQAWCVYFVAVLLYSARVGVLTTVILTIIELMVFSFRMIAIYLMLILFIFFQITPGSEEAQIILSPPTVLMMFILQITLIFGVSFYVRLAKKVLPLIIFLIKYLLTVWLILALLFLIGQFGENSPFFIGKFLGVQPVELNAMKIHIMIATFLCMFNVPGRTY